MEDSLPAVGDFSSLITQPVPSGAYAPPSNRIFSFSLLAALSKILRIKVVHMSKAICPSPLQPLFVGHK
jgi:hypothetical protein